MRAFSLLLLMTVTANAQYQVPIECAALAQKEGYGSVIETKKDLLKAKARLVYLRATNPRNKEIKECDRVVNELVSRLLQE